MQVVTTIATLAVPRITMTEKEGPRTLPRAGRNNCRGVEMKCWLVDEIGPLHVAVRGESQQDSACHPPYLGAAS